MYLTDFSSNVVINDKDLDTTRENVLIKKYVDIVVESTHLKTVS